MASFKLDSRVRESFATSGAGDITTLGAVTGGAGGARAFGSFMSTGDTTWATAGKGNQSQEGLVTFTAPSTLSWTIIFRNSDNTTTPINFAPGDGEIFCDIPARVLDTLNLTEITVASAATCDIGAAQGMRIAIGGTTGPIASFGSVPNKLRVVRHSGSTIVHDGVAITLKGGISRTTVAGDIGIYVSDGSGHWTEIVWQPLSDVAVPPQCRLTLTSGTPTMRSSVAGATRVFITPVGGGSMPVKTAAGITRVTMSEIYQDTTDTTKSPAAVIANANYDMLFWADPAAGLCLSRSDYWKKSATVTMTIASPGVVTWTGNTFADGTPFVLSTTGALPTGLTAGVTYFVKQTTLGVIADTFRLSATPGGAAINTSGVQSGVHTATAGEDVPLIARGSGGNCEIQWINGLPFNKNAITNGPGAGMGLVVGSIGSNSSATIDFIYGGLAAGGLAGVFMVSNAFNPELIASFTGDSTAAWNPTTTAWHAGNNSATMRCNLLRCFDVGMLRGKYKSIGTPFTGNLKIGIGLDSTTSFIGSSGITANTTLLGEMNADYSGQPGVGRHFLSGNESQSSASASTFLGNGGGAAFIQTGLHSELFV